MSGLTRPYVIPWMTTLILGVVAAIFVMQQRYGLNPSGPNLTPSVETLLAFGAISSKLVEQGEIFRMLSAPFLHGSLRHLEADLIALAVVGYSLERRIGRAWLSCIFATGGLAGSVVALLVSGDGVTVGGSGGVMAMITANVVVTFRSSVNDDPESDDKARLRLLMAVMLGVALYPLTQIHFAHIGYGAHLGGAILGIMLGGLLIATWWDDEMMPSFQLPAAGLSLAAVISSTIIGFAVAAHFP
jgi:rhomboid protease GluP